MTRAEKLTYTQGLEARIVELEEQVARQAQRILTLAGVDATKPGFDAAGGVPFGVQRMAAGMKLPTTPDSQFDAQVSANANRIRASRLAN